MVLILLILSQSFFSTRGLGEDLLLSDAVMGAYGRRVSLSLLNPAYGSKFPAASFFLTGLGEMVYAHEERRGRLFWGIRPETFITLIPIPYGFGLSLGVYEKFNQDFDIFSDSISSSGISYRHHVRSEGGVYRASIGGWKDFFNLVSIGSEYNYLFGGSTEEWLLEILGGEHLTKDSCSIKYRGGCFTTGLLVKTRLFSFGALYESDVKLNISTHIKTVAQTDSFKLNGSLPYSYGFGFILSPIKDLQLSLDYFKRTWADTIGKMEFVNSDKYSLGVGYRSLRIGYGHTNWASPSSKGSPIKEDMVSIGYPLPLRPWGTLQLCLGMGMRKGDGLTEEIGRVSFTFFFQEPWKKRKRKWGW